MKTVLQSLLFVLFLISFTVLVISAVIKFKFLDYNFWITSFNSSDTYSQLASGIKESVVNQISKEGGSKNDIAVFTDLITPENVKDFTDRNLSNLLNFTNSKSNDLLVYVPFSIIPNGFLPKNFALTKNEMTLKEFGQKFNISGLDTIPINDLRTFGSSVNYTFFGSLLLVVIIMILMFTLTDGGRKLIFISLNFIFGGLIILGLNEVGKSFVTYLQTTNTAQSGLTKMTAGIVLPSVINEITKGGIYVVISFIIIGVVILFIKKPGNQKK